MTRLTLPAELSVRPAGRDHASLRARATRQAHVRTRRAGLPLDPLAA
jgi:hypothetical protein